MIDHLIVIAGPSSAGKSTLARRMRKNECPELSERLGMDDLSSAPNMRLGDLPAGASITQDIAILQYNITRDHNRPQDYAHPILSQANRLSMITLWTPPKRLLRHRLARMRKNLGGENGRSISWHMQALVKTARYHARPGKVLANYQSWFAFCADRHEHMSEHLIVECRDDVRFLSREEWEAEVQGYRT